MPPATTATPALSDEEVLQFMELLKGADKGSRILELSTRCNTNEAFQVAAETRAFLLQRGVDLSGEQETKTRKALRHFARAGADAKA